MRNIPSLQTALQILAEAESRNPGPWAAHSRNVGEAARRIAEKTPDLHPEAAEILGILHDIGRREGVSDMRHIIDGYRYMIRLGYDDAARICLTHSFPLQNVHTMDDNWDGTPEDYAVVSRFLDSITYTGYDRLIQLCDALALPSGFCLIEKRMVEVGLRRGVNALTVPKWRAFFDIQRSFEQQIGCPVYSLLPGVVENTFHSTL